MNMNLIVLIVIGVLILGSSVIPSVRLTKRLPPGKMRRLWRYFPISIAVIIVGYVLAIIFIPSDLLQAYGILVPAGLILLGCILVLLSAFLLQSMRMGELEHEVIVDALTGTYNRRFLYRRLEEEVSRSRRYGQPLTCILVDIDGLEAVNANYGHKVGDKILSRLGEMMRMNVRDVDIPARLEGDEVVVLSPNTSLAGAKALAERLRERAEPIKVPSGDGPVGCSVSIGVAVLDDNISDAKEFLTVTDDAMYRAREKGGNRVHVHGEE